MEVPQHPGQGDASFFEDPMGSQRTSSPSGASESEEGEECDEFDELSGEELRQEFDRFRRVERFVKLGSPP